MASSGGEFESILGEGASYQEAANSLRQQSSSRRSGSSSSPIIRVPDGSPAATVMLTSSVTADFDDLILENDAEMDSSMVEEEAAYDPLVDNQIMKRQHERKVKKEQSKGAVMKYVKNPLLLVKGKDFSDVTLTVLIPAFVSFLVIKKVAGIGMGTLKEKADKIYGKFTYDYSKQVGDYEEMEQVFKDYKKKLWFNGAPSYVSTKLMQTLARDYCKNVRLSPVSVSSLAYTMTLMKLSDNEVAEAFVEAWQSDKRNVATTSQLVFYGTQMFKDKAAMKTLNPLIKMLKDMTGDMELMQDAQKEIGAAGYRDAIAEKGEGQTKPLKGWEWVGLSKEEATKIFEETRDMGYLGAQEYNIKLQEDARVERMKDEMERKWLAELKLENPDIDLENPPEFVEDKNEVAKGETIKECTKCGYVLFIAKGREGKFFSAGFKCPQCGAPKDKFKDLDPSDIED